MTLGTSTPLTPDQIRAALTKFGAQVNYIAGWETRNRGLRGDGWGPVNGFVVHHTGDDAPDDADLNVVQNGRADLPGPLAQFGIRDNGVIDVIGCGRANHAGTGDSKILALIQSENYDFVLPAPVDDGFDGNGRFYGVETYYSGSHTPTQYKAMVNLCAAICDAHGWTGKSVLGHREWTKTKIDPGSVDMAQFRRDVNARIAEVNRPQPVVVSRSVTRAPIPVPAPATKPNIKVSNLRPGYKNADVKAYNALLWSKQGLAYKASHLAMWMAGSSWVFDKATEEVTWDTYFHNQKTLGTPPSRPCWPGPQLIRFLGANPV